MIFSKKSYFNKALSEIGEMLTWCASKLEQKSQIIILSVWRNFVTFSKLTLLLVWGLWILEVSREKERKKCEIAALDKVLRIRKRKIDEKIIICECKWHNWENQKVISHMVWSNYSLHSFRLWQGAWAYGIIQTSETDLWSELGNLLKLDRHTTLHDVQWDEELINLKEAKINIYDGKLCETSSMFSVTNCNSLSLPRSTPQPNSSTS